MRTLTLLASVLLAVLLSPGAGAERRVAILIDTSGSMTKNDPRRYTVQVSKVVSDLLAVEDQLTVIRLPRHDREPKRSECSTPARRSLGLELNVRDRVGFKRNLDRHIDYRGGNFFASPVRTASEFLSAGTGPRLLLMLADAGGFSPCDTELNAVVRALARRGVLLASINLGRGSTFDRSRGFRISRTVGNSRELIRAVAEVYQQFLGAKQVQTGLLDAIRLDVAPYVQRAFLVVAADGPVLSVADPGGNPGAADVDTNYRGGGTTRGLDRVTRGYRIVRLKDPRPGSWRFRVQGTSSGGAWMLVQESAVGVRLLRPAAIVRGAPSPVQLELYDVTTGRSIKDPASIPGLRVEAKLAGKVLRFRDDGANGDEVAGDGILTARHLFDNAGEHDLAVRVESDLLEQTSVLKVRPGEVRWVLEPDSPRRSEVGEPAELRASLRPDGPMAALRRPDRIEVQTGQGTVTLRDDGRAPDRTASDLVYSGRFTPRNVGNLRLRYTAVGGSQAEPANGSLEVFLVAVGWVLEPRSPPRAEAGGAVLLQAGLVPDGPSDRLMAPERIEVWVEGKAVTLRDDGTLGDETAGDRLYTGNFTPLRVATLELRYSAVGGSSTEPVAGSLEVLGRLEFGPPIPIRLEDARSAAAVLGTLDLSNTEVFGSYDLKVTSDFGASRSALAIQKDGAWLPLDERGARIELGPGRPRVFPLRLTVVDCPAPVSRDRGFSVTVTAGSATLRVPLSIRVVPDSWLHCWWPVLAGLAGLALAGFVFYGFWSPSRFPPRIGLVLSPEEDMNEGFFHPIRAQAGTGSGFYRDARVYVLTDYRLSGSARGALACIRADGSQLRIRAVGGSSLFKQTSDGDWQPLEPDETSARSGVVFKSDLDSLFFELRAS